ncbi:MAG TPA: diguanylate cyclase [Gemmatimonadales bacterium]|jgi:diguanylate cyclase (GGDEF)-like protein
MSGRGHVDARARPRIQLAGEVGARPEGLERALTRAGFQLTEVSGGDHDPEPDAVLLTLVDASDTQLAALRHHRAPSPPVLVLFAASDPDAPAAALAHGADDAMAAPIHFPELRARLESRIRDRQAPRRTLREEKIRESLDELVALSQPTLRPDEVVLALVRRLARAFDLARCTLVLTVPGPEQGQVVADAGAQGPEQRIDLTGYPEIAEAVRTRRPVAMPDLEPSAIGPAPITMVLPVPSSADVPGVLLLRTRESQPRLSSVQLEFAESLAQATGRALEASLAGDRNGRQIVRTLATLRGTAAALTLERRLAEEYERARRYSLSFSLVLLGVNGAAGADQASGQGAVGDGLVQELETRLRRELRLPDFVSRYGDDELAVVLPETGAEGARRSVYRVRERLSAAPPPSASERSVGRLAAGIVTYPHPSVGQADDLLALVETALVRGRAQSEERIGVAE